MKNLSLHVPAMHCQHCVHTIKMELSDLNGVDAVNVNLDERQVDITFDAPVSEDDIRDLLREINYPAES